MNRLLSQLSYSAIFTRTFSSLTHECLNIIPQTKAFVKGLEQSFLLFFGIVRDVLKTGGGRAKFVCFCA